MTPKYSIRAFDERGGIASSASTGSIRAARHIAKALLKDHNQVDLYEYKGMREGVALYERVTL